MALEIEAELTEAGGGGGRPGRQPRGGDLIEAEPIDAALLDANLAGKPVDALAAALAARGVPFAFASGYGPSGLPEGFRDRPLIGKPFGSEALVALVRGLLAPADDGTVVPLRKRDLEGVPRAERGRVGCRYPVDIKKISLTAGRPRRRR